MDHETKLRLSAAGVNVDSALARFMNNASLMEKFLRRFPTDPNYENLCRALKQGDVEAAFTAAHTLKGVSGNLSLERLFAATCDVVEALRAKDLAAAQAHLPALQNAYDDVLAALAAW